MLLVFEPLLRFDPQTLRPVPAAAREPPRVSADGLTYTAVLRDDLAYSDGQRVSANDFVFGLRRLCSETNPGEYAFVGFIVAGCQGLHDTGRGALGVHALDERTVEYRLVEPAAYFPAILSLWVTAPVREDLVRRGGERWTDPATYLGNGAFVLREWRRGERIVFERNERHAPRAKLKRVVRRVLDAKAQRTAFERGEVDLYQLGPDDRTTVEGGPAAPDRLVRAPGGCTFAVGFNTERPPFDDPKLRLAFAKSLDRGAFIKDVQSGLGLAHPSFVAAGLPGHDRDDETQRFDRPAARKLVAESAYAVGIPDTRFTYLSSPLTKARVEWVVEQWRSSLVLSVIPDPVARADVAVRRPEDRPQLFAITWCGDYPDPQAWLSLFLSGSSYNRQTMGYRSDDFDRLARAADAERDEARRADLSRAAQRVLTRDAPAAFLWSSQSYYLVKPWVGGIAPTAADPIFGVLAQGELFVSARR